MPRRWTKFFWPEDEAAAADLPWRMFWVGLSLRVLYMTVAHTWRIRVILDHFQFGWELGRIARAVATGHGYADPFLGHTGPTTWIPPLYTLILAGVFKVFGVYTAKSAWVILAINSIFSAATAVTVFRIADRCFGRRVAIWSGWTWTLYPAAMQYAVHWIWDMSLSTWLFAMAIELALRLRGVGETNSPERAPWRVWAAFGLLWGMIAMSNPSLMIALPAFLVWIGWAALGQRRGVGRVVAGAALASFVTIACMTPWMWRNWQVFGAFIPTRGNLGAELYQSTLAENNGFPWGATLPMAETDPLMQRYKEIGEVRYVREKGAEAKLAIRQNPRRILGWMGKRVYFFWAGVPHPLEGTGAVEYAREVNYGFLSVTGLLGLILAIRNRIAGSWLFFWAFALVPLIYYLVTVQARFRHSLEPLICVLTVYLFQSAEKGRTFSWTAATDKRG